MLALIDVQQSGYTQCLKLLEIKGRNNTDS